MSEPRKYEVELLPFGGVGAGGGYGGSGENDVSHGSNGYSGAPPPPSIMLRNPAGSGIALNVFEGDEEIAHLLPGSWLRVRTSCIWDEAPIDPEPDVIAE
jgi:hypothetical protein